MPRGKLWRDLHLWDDQVAQAVLLTRHLSERGTCRGTTSWADTLGQFKIGPQTCESDGAEPGPLPCPVHPPQSTATMAQLSAPAELLRQAPIPARGCQTAAGA